MKSAAYVLDVDGQRFQFQVFDDVEPRFSETLIESFIRNGEFHPAPTVNWINNDGTWHQVQAIY
jgi:hypothetical protein